MVQSILEDNWLLLSVIFAWNLVGPQLPSALVFAASTSLVFFSCLVSGEYLAKSLNKDSAEIMDEVGTLVFSDSVGELGDGGWHFESSEENSLLPLEQNVLWPSEKPCHVSLWLDVVPDSEVLWSGFEKRVSLGVFLGGSFGGFFLDLFLDGRCNHFL